MESRPMVHVIAVTLIVPDKGVLESQQHLPEKIDTIISKWAKFQQSNSISFKVELSIEHYDQLHAYPITYVFLC